MHIKKGDEVVIITGKDRGKTGKVVRSLPKIGKILVEGLNLVKRRQRSRRDGQKGQVVSVSMPIHISNAMTIDPKSGKRSRIGIKIVNDKKIRVSKKSGASI